MLEKVTKNIRSPRFILAFTLSALTAALVAGPLAYQAINARSETHVGPADDGITTVTTGPGPEPPSTLLTD